MMKINQSLISRRTLFCKIHKSGHNSVPGQCKYSITYFL